MSNKALQVIACDILKEEIEECFRILQIDADFEWIPSIYHCSFPKLKESVFRAAENTDARILMIFGLCHPQILQWERDFGWKRIQAANCVEMVLGPQISRKVMEDRAFLLFKRTALNWFGNLNDYIGNEKDTIEMFRGEIRYFLGMKSKFQYGFEDRAEEISSQYQIPVKWKVYDIEYLIKLIKDVLI